MNDLSNPNVIGYVTEFIEDGAQIRLKLKLRNTLGKVREVVVDAPSDLVDFFEAKLSPEILAASAAELNAKSG